MEKRLLVGLVTGLFLVGMAGSASALSFTNGSFETGDFTGWGVTNSSGGSASVVTTDAGFFATDGEYFANLTADSLITQSQSWEAGETFSFDWNFNANDYSPWYDYSLLSITDTSNVVIDSITLSDVATVGDYDATGWNTYEYTFASAGSGYIGFGVYNYGDTLNDSQLYIDNVSGTAPVPEPATMLLFGTGLAGLVGLRRRKNKK